MLGIIFTTSVILTISAATFFYENPDEIYNKTTLAAIDIVRKPETKTAKRKNTKHVKKLVKKSPALRKKTTKYSSGRIIVSGFRGQDFVYGEVIVRKDGKLEGFIYHPDNSKTYVYGEKVDKRINLYDSSGNLYQMLGEGSSGH